VDGRSHPYEARSGVSDIDDNTAPKASPENKERKTLPDLHLSLTWDSEKYA
jgi:hypothetical protein